MYRLLTVALATASLAACSSGGDDHEPDYTPEEWFPIGAYQLTEPSGFLANSIMQVAPPIIDLGLDEYGERIRFDPNVDYGEPYEVTIFQPYELQAAVGPVLCYHSSKTRAATNPDDIAGFGALHDPTYGGQAYIKQYNATKGDFHVVDVDVDVENEEESYQGVRTQLSIEDVNGNWVADYDVKGRLLLVPEQVEEPAPEVKTMLEEVNVRSLCAHGGFDDTDGSTGINMRAQLEGLTNSRTTLDLPRRPLTPGLKYNLNGTPVFRIVSETEDRVVASLTGTDTYGEIDEIGEGTTHEVGATYSVKNGVQTYTLDEPLEAFDTWPEYTGLNSNGTFNIKWHKYRSAVITDFSMPKPMPYYYPDYQAYNSFPNTLDVIGFHFNREGNEERIWQAWR